MHVYIYEDGKQEVFKEKRELDDEKMAVTFRGLDGHVMEQLKVYDVIFQFIPKSQEGCARLQSHYDLGEALRRLSGANQVHEVRHELGC